MGKVRMPRRKTSTNTNFFDQNVSYGGDSNSSIEAMDSEKEQKATLRPTGRRRGRGPSKNPCLNRNALMARENRQRKKEYLEKVENKLAHLQSENQDLKLAIQRQGQENQKLKIEVNHLRSVMQNSTTVTRLLKAINDSLESSRMDTSSTALTERLNINEENNRGLKNNTNERVQSSLSMHTSCAASSTSNEENSDPLYDQGEALISKLARLVEEPDLEDATCGVTKKPRFQDNVYSWDKDDVLDPNPSMDSISSDLPGWEDDKKMNILSTTKSDFTDDFSVDSLFENLNDSTTSNSIDQTQLEHTFGENPCDTSNDILPNVGVCIHVNRNKVSLEYCAECHARVNEMERNNGGQK